MVIFHCYVSSPEGNQWVKSLYHHKFLWYISSMGKNILVQTGKKYTHPGGFFLWIFPLKKHGDFQ